MLRNRRADASILERLELLEALQRQHAVHERSSQWPPLCIDAKASERSIAKETCDRDVGYRKRSADEAFARELRFEIVDHVRDLYRQCLLRRLLIGFLTPHIRDDRNLVEQLPDEHVAHARV